jgi:predicted aspartyl protease
VGLLTVWPQRIEIRTRPAPGMPGQTQIGFALGGGAEALIIRGIIVNVAVGVDIYTAESIRAQGENVPDPFSCKALVDTGASCLGIDVSIVQKLGLVRRGVTTNHTAAGPVRANLYAASLLFPGSNLRTYELLRSSEVDLSTQPFKCLIGRDVMTNWHIHYNGQTGAVSIAD